MDFDPNEGDFLPNKGKNTLKRIIIREYVYIFATIIFAYFLIPYLFTLSIDDNDYRGFSGLASGLALVAIMRLGQYILILIFFIINPIRILIKKRYRIKEIFPRIKRILVIMLVLIPIFVGSLPLLERPISDYQFDKQYNRSKNQYTVSKSKYKNPMYFYNELKTRDLLYDTNTYYLEDKLNGDHDCVNYIPVGDDQISQKCYSKSTMFGLADEEFFDDIDKENITSMSQKKFPVYVYNSILTLPSYNESLQYAALGRFSYNSDDYGDYSAYFEDYYIECKILYIDGNIYAMIGPDSSYDIKHYFDDYKKIDYVTDILPFYVILSEKDTITTFKNDKFHPNGSIENKVDSFEMYPNKKPYDIRIKFPIKKVDRLDRNAINDYAYEIQQGILKESIDYHFKKRNPN